MSNLYSPPVDFAVRDSRAPRAWGADVLVGAAVTILGAALRFIRLNKPPGIVPLDEFYYPVNSLGLLRHGTDMTLAKGSHLPAACSSVHLEPAFAVHPPVGKWMIAAGIKAFGCNAFGWRVAAALVGTISVLLVYLIARRLIGRPWIAGITALLMAIDGLQLVQSRIGMLDIFESFWIVLALWLLVEDIVRSRSRAPSEAAGFGGWLARRRWWRISSGVAIGLGAATKWSTVPLLPIFILIAFFFEIARVRQRVPQADFDTGDVTPAGLARSEEEEPPPISGAQEEPPSEDEPPPPPAEDTPPAADHEPAPVEEPAVPEVPEEEPPAAPGPPPPPWQPSFPPAAVVVPPRRGWREIATQSGIIIVTFFLLPILIYIASYIPWFFAKSARYVAPRCNGKITFVGSFPAPPNRDPFDSKIWNWSIWPHNWKAWVCYQREIFDFHEHLKTFDEKGAPTHPYLARAWSWPWMGRPASHFFDAHGFDQPCEQPPKAGANPDPSRLCKSEAEILGLSNPVMWFPAFFLAIPLCAWWAVRRRDQVASILLLLFAGLFLPWLITTRPLFLFYMTPAVPILVLMTGHMLARAIEEFRPSQLIVLFGLCFALPFTPLFIQWLGSGRPLLLLYKIPTLLVLLLVAGGIASVLAFEPRPRRLVYAYAALAIAAIVYFYPVVAAAHIPDGGVFGWRHHMWLQLDCNSKGIKLACWI